jgi:hypothetical protein
MVGVPGKSKGCNTCRRRKVKVFAAGFFPPSLHAVLTVDSVIKESLTAKDV